MGQVLSFCFRQLRNISMLRRLGNFFVCGAKPGDSKRKYDRSESTIIEMSTDTSMQTRYQAAMVLSGVGDAMGYYGGAWEFNYNGQEIHAQLNSMGGIDELDINTRDFPVSDDTVMHIATAKAMVNERKGEFKEDLYKRIAEEYIECMKDMTGRGPGPTCIGGVNRLRPDKPNGFRVPFNPRGGGCGAAMRAMCIGLRYPYPENLHDLIAVSVESGRMTHNHPTGYLGSLAAALFTSYAIQKKPVVAWGYGLMETLPKVSEYVKEIGIDVGKNEEAWGYFSDQWETYLNLRKIQDGRSTPIFPEKYGVGERDEFYSSISWAGWGGSSGHDAPMIVYDALLSYDGTWPDLCRRAMLHGGDNDSTGVIAGCCYGAMFGFQTVADKNHVNLEYRKILANLADKLYNLSHPDGDELKPGANSKQEKTMPDTVPAKVAKTDMETGDQDTSKPDGSIEGSTEGGEHEQEGVTVANNDADKQTDITESKNGAEIVTTNDENDSMDIENTTTTLSQDTGALETQELKDKRSETNQPKTSVDTANSVEGISSTATGESPEKNSDPLPQTNPDSLSTEVDVENEEKVQQTVTSSNTTAVDEAANNDTEASEATNDPGELSPEQISEDTRL